MKLKDLYENLHLKKSDDHTENHDYHLIDTDDLQYINFKMALPLCLHIDHKNDKSIIEKMEMFVNTIGVEGFKNTEKLLDFIENYIDIFKDQLLITILKNILSRKHYGYSDWFIPSIEECLKYKEQIPNNIASSSFYIRNFGFLKTQIGSKAIDNNDPFKLKLILIRKK